jgi:hypothetical protein
MPCDGLRSSMVSPAAFAAVERAAPGSDPDPRQPAAAQAAGALPMRILVPIVEIAAARIVIVLDAADRAQQTNRHAHPVMLADFAARHGHGVEVAALLVKVATLAQFERYNRPPLSGPPTLRLPVTAPALAKKSATATRRRRAPRVVCTKRGAAFTVRAILALEATL